MRLLAVDRGRRDGGDHRGHGAAPQRVREQVGELAVPVGDVRPRAVPAVPGTLGALGEEGQAADDEAQLHQAPVDLRRFLQLGARGLGPLRALATSQVDEVADAVAGNAAIFVGAVVEDGLIRKNLAECICQKQTGPLEEARGGRVPEAALDPEANNLTRPSNFRPVNTLSR